MRHNLRLLAAVLCAISLAAAHSQTPITSPRSPAATAIPSAMSFQYDAQHDQILATGVQIKPTAAAAVSFVPITGTLVVTINITAVSHFRRGTTYHCSLIAVGGLLDQTSAVVSGGLETAFGLAKWTGTNTLACTLTIPYEWNLVPDPAADRGALLAFGVSAVAPPENGGIHSDLAIRSSSTPGTVQRSTFQVDGIEPLPPSGTTSTFAFNVTL